MRSRLHLIVEGQTEMQFVNQTLVPYLSMHEVDADARCVFTSKDGARWHRGGLLDYQKAKTDITLWIKQEGHLQDVYFSTMFDLYALPKNFPGYDEAKRCTDHYQKVGLLEDKLKEDIGRHRFIPYIQLYEFETLILADPQQLDCMFLESGTGIRNLIEITDGKNPEEINDDPETAPSKRIIREIPGYDHMKTIAGPTVAGKIGLENLRRRCRHFDAWLSKLEQLSKTE